MNALPNYLSALRIALVIPIAWLLAATGHERLLADVVCWVV